MNADQADRRPPFKSIQVQFDGDRVWLRRHVRQYASAGFLLVWLAIWTVACAWLALKLLREQKFEILPFALPSWSSWIFVACQVAWMLFGTESVVIDSKFVESWTSLFLDFKRRRVPVTDVRGLVGNSVVTDEESGQRTWRLSILTTGRPICVFSSPRADEHDWLEQQVRWHLARVGQKSPPSAPGKPGADPEVVQATSHLPDRPADSTIAAEPVWEGTALTRQGRLEASSLGTISFIAIFWNAIVCVFLLQLVKPDGIGGQRVFLAVFVIPFVVIGLAIMAAWAQTASAPLRCERWTISRQGLTARFEVMGLGRNRWIGADMLSRVEIRRRRPGRRVVRGADNVDPAGTVWLVLVDRAQGDALRIGDLSEGEARWLGSCMLEGWKPDYPELALGKGSPAPLWDRDLDA